MDFQMAAQEKKYHEELKLEVQGEKFSAVQNDVEIEDAEVDGEPDLIQQQAEDAANLSEVGMSRKKRKLLQAMKVRKLINVFLFSLVLDIVNEMVTIIF